MYTFIIQNKKTVTEIAFIRAILAMTAVMICVYANVNYYMSYVFAVILLTLSFFMNSINKKIRGGQWIALLIAAIALFFSSVSWYFSLLILLYAAMIKWLITDTQIVIGEKEIMIRQNYRVKQYSWSAFNNIILKDGLLTLDYANNTIRSFIVDDQRDEIKFNAFCSQQLLLAQQ